MSIDCRNGPPSASEKYQFKHIVARSGRTKTLELIKRGRPKTIKIGRKSLVKVSNAQRLINELSQEAQR